MKMKKLNILICGLLSLSLLSSNINSYIYAKEPVKEPFIKRKYDLNTDINDTVNALSKLSKTIGSYLISGETNVLSAPKQYGAFPNHILDTGVSPEGTDITLYDYWTYDGDENRFKSDANTSTLDGGINHHGDSIRFIGQRGGPLQTGCNTAQSYSKVTAGIVGNRLHASGIPVYSNNTKYHPTNLQGKPLENIFGKENKNGKKVFKNVKNLLQINAEGYYYYDANKNFAEFDETKNRFNLYDTRALSKNPPFNRGMFFPFNQASEVFYEKNGKLIENSDLNTDFDGRPQKNPLIHHYFGLNLNTKFIQTENGRNKGKDVEFNFSGDDDVWVFIDGVLVGDVGGLHAPVDLNINFNTGVVEVKGDFGGPNGEPPTRETTTLKKCFEKAGVSSKFDGNTFADNTEHTLSFFYLERGNDLANLKLEYNLIDVPSPSYMKKVDDQGKPMVGVAFDLIATDRDYASEGETVFTGKTMENGILELKDENGKNITLNQLQEKSSNYILREKENPLGYRKGKDVHLSFAQTADSPYWKVDNQWESGAYSETSANYSVYHIPDHLMNNGEEILCLIKEKGSDTYFYQDNQGNWLKGDLEKAVSHYPAFKKNEVTGFYTGSVKLPLNYSPDKYELLLRVVDRNNAVNNDTQLSYNLNMSSNLVVANIKNQFQVEKVNSNNNPIANVRFDLYTTPDATGSSYDWGVTDENGKITFGLEGTSDNKSPLVSGETYYLKETAPNGYIAHEEVIEVVVAEDGIYANAKEADDYVTVKLGLGRIIKTMEPFASDNMIDSSLFNIVTVSNTTQDPSHWDTSNKKDEYHAKYTDRGYTEKGSNKDRDYFDEFEEGYVRLEPRQCREHNDTSNGGEKQRIENSNLSSLFTGQVIVKVRNDKKAVLRLEKQVISGNDPNKEFAFIIDFKNITDNKTFDAKYIDGNSTGNFITVHDEEIFTLKDKDVIEVLIPENEAFTIKEINEDGEFYTQHYVKPNEGEPIKLEGAEYANINGVKLNESIHIVFENSYEWAEFSFVKTNGGTTTLPGAKFVLYEKTCDESHNDELSVDESGNLNNSNDEYCWKQIRNITTEDDGQVRLDKLKPTKEYRLIEYKAPDGFLLPNGQWKLTFMKSNSGYTSQIDKIGNPPAFATDTDSKLTLPNYKLLQAPITGSMGIGLLAAIGSLLMVIGGVLYKNRKNRLKNDNKGKEI